MTRGRRALIRTIALSIIAATLGAWLAYVVLASEDANPNIAQGRSHRDGPIHPTTALHDSANGTGHSADGLNHTSEEHSMAPVAVMMAADPDVVAFCVGASMEPFEGAMTQLHDYGPYEASERMRICVFEVIIGHGDDATMIDLESHRPGFASCFGELQNVVGIDKPTFVEQVSACIMAGLETP